MAGMEEKVMAHPTPPTLLLVLTEDQDPLRVAVTLESFLQFSQEIADGLEDIEFRWHHRAAPAANMAAFSRGALPGELTDETK